MAPDDLDERLRAAAFACLDRLRQRQGDRFSYRDLKAFEFEGRRVSLIQRMRGIRVVAGLDAALSILTTYRARPEELPYEDAEGPDGYWRYKWRGMNPKGYDNVALRRAMELGRPLVWFVGVAQGTYTPIYPVWLVGEEPAEHQFVVALDAEMRAQWEDANLYHPADLALRRQYAASRGAPAPAPAGVPGAGADRLSVPVRAVPAPAPGAAGRGPHQKDSEGGLPVVPKGVAMCAIHHRSFDADVLTVRPDYVIEVRRDVREERDGPTLQHALQGLHGKKLVLPRPRAAWPDPELLEERYERLLCHTRE